MIGQRGKLSGKLDNLLIAWLILNRSAFVTTKPPLPNPPQFGEGTWGSQLDPLP